MHTFPKTFVLSFLAVTGMVIAGCENQTNIGGTKIDTSNHKLVSLKVPNMT